MVENISACSNVALLTAWYHGGVVDMTFIGGVSASTQEDASFTYIKTRSRGADRVI